MQCSALSSSQRPWTGLLHHAIRCHTIADVPDDAQENFVPSETDDVANAMLDLFAAEPGAIEAVEG